MAPTTPTPNPKSSGGTGGNSGERLAKLESDVYYIKRDIGEIKTDIKEIRVDMRTDFKWLLGVGIGGLVGLGGILGGLMAKGFHWIP
jgi:hypothetical protein